MLLVLFGLCLKYLQKQIIIIIMTLVWEQYRAQVRDCEETTGEEAHLWDDRRWSE